jgi:hypothetical protein
LPSQAAVVPSVFAPTPKVKLRMPPGPSGLTLKFSRPKSMDSPGTPGPSPLSNAPIQTPTPSLPGPTPKIVLRLPPRSTPVKQELVDPAVAETPNPTPRIKLTFRLPPKMDKPIAQVTSDMMDVDPVVDDNFDKVASLKDAKPSVDLVSPRQVDETPKPKLKLKFKFNSGK